MKTVQDFDIPNECEFIASEGADLPKHLSRRLVFRFLLNADAWSHPDYKHMYIEAAKIFLWNTYNQIYDYEIKGPGPIRSDLPQTCHYSVADTV